MRDVVVLNPSPLLPPRPTLYEQFVREYPGEAKVREDLQIATKFAPYPYRIGSQSIITACDETLERVEADVSVSPARVLIQGVYACAARKPTMRLAYAIVASSPRGFPGLRVWTWRKE